MPRECQNIYLLFLLARLNTGSACYLFALANGVDIMSQ